eukprot:TRINITY_DN67300_c0_g1_i1.p1 TRINITY_DN67300_c0_g1~~TRINITY_DN67300_c0_g1_i1.p1  ORF type:complete len:599 (-),score=78.95 TRINITY_DN67300_c0_g1_i1:33-1802(-)
MMSPGPTRTPKITKHIRPKSAPQDGVTSSLVLLDAHAANPAPGKAQGGKAKPRPKSSPDYVSPRPPAAAEITPVVAPVAPIPAHPHHLPKKRVAFQGSLEVQPEVAVVAAPAVIVRAPVPPSKTPEPEPVDEVVDEKVEEEVFEDDFDTDEETPIPHGEPWKLNPAVWGRLISLHGNLPNIDLEKAEGNDFSLGRNGKCDVTIDDPHISSTQFVVTMYSRRKGEIEIRDRSSNGTFLNGTVIGKGKSKSLSNGDEITFQVGSAQFGTGFAGYIFQFLSMDCTKPGGAGSDPKSTSRRTPKVKYKISDMIGKGGFASVYLGMNVETGELLAVKQIAVSRDETEKIRDICKEIELLRSLHHSKVVSYYGYDVGTHHLNILLEYVPGGSIASLLSKFGRFEEPVIRAYTLQILIGLQYLHDNNVLHRDIKAANILVTQLGTIKLTDFGASAAIGAMKIKEGTDKGDGNRGLQGTALWMAPEVITNTQYSKASDVWATGCTVIEMATGQPPWAERNFTSCISAMYFIGNSNETPQIPTQGLSAMGQNFLRQCLRLDANERLLCPDLLRHPFLASSGMEAGVPMSVNLSVRARK